MNVWFQKWMKWQWFHRWAGDRGVKGENPPPLKLRRTRVNGEWWKVRSEKWKSTFAEATVDKGEKWKRWEQQLKKATEDRPNDLRLRYMPLLKLRQLKKATANKEWQNDQHSDFWSTAKHISVHRMGDASGMWWHWCFHRNCTEYDEGKESDPSWVWSLWKNGVKWNE